VKLRDHAKSLGLDVGCSDSGCIWGSPGGMCTNGGCRCLDPRDDKTSSLEARRFARVAQHLAAEVERIDGECTALAKDLASKHESQRSLRTESRLLRADIERMRPVAETALARRLAFHARHAGDIDEEAYGAAREAFQAALDAYEKEVSRG
jgi:hypothetical protein